jgi:hypothetical protein
MAAVDGLVEVAGRAAQAEAMGRAVTWLDGPDVEAAVRRVDKALAADRTALSRPPVAAVLPAPLWQQRVAAMTAPERDTAVVLPDDPLAAAAEAEANADAAVAVARLALVEAQRAVLLARAGCLRAGDDGVAGEAARGYRSLPARHLAIRYAGPLGSAAGGELNQVVTGRSKSILIKLAVGLGLGLAYLAFLRLFQWETKSEFLPYLAPYALSGVIGGVVCTNALSWDAARVRAALVGGQRLWLILVSKNVAMFLLVGAVGLVLCIVLALWAGEPGALITSIAELVTMMLVWLGIGNVLSVWRPLRVEPLRARFSDGTLWPFLFSFAMSYGVGLGVNLILTWKIWAKQSMIAELGGVWVPVLMLTATSLVTWALLTVLAVSLADLPQTRRELLREMVDYKATASTVSG